jgi:RNA chaperone Hfq
MEPNLLDRMLNAYMAEQKTVTVTLQNKVRVSGRITSFDSYILVLDGQRREIIYRHAISSVSLYVADEAVRPVPAQKPAQKSPQQKANSHERPKRPSSSDTPSPGKDKEHGINTGMKDGLLKWMQGQKAAK